MLFIVYQIRASYDRLLGELELVNNWAHATGPGAWGDADIMEVGNKGLSVPEARSHFALWCLIKSPLLIGCDVTTRRFCSHSQEQR